MYIIFFNSSLSVPPQPSAPPERKQTRKHRVCLVKVPALVSRREGARGGPSSQPASARRCLLTYAAQYISLNKGAYAFNALLREGLFSKPDPKSELRGSCVSQDQTRENVTNANKK